MSDVTRAAHAAWIRDRAANAAYPKSRIVLRWFRACQSWGARRGPVARAVYVALASSYKLFTEWVMGVELPPTTRVGPGLRLRHAVGLVVNPHTVIGANVMLRHGVTLGNRRTATDCPVIEDGVEIGAGAVIIGAVTIGRGARIGPNAVVIRDVPPGAVVRSPLGELVPAWPAAVDRARSAS